MPLVINANTCYVYRHVRLDKNIPFYIGIGSDNKYYRANYTKKRNPYWNKIVSNTEYKIDILLDNLTWEEACAKEKEFIKLYGRHDLNLGALSNMTDGGDGSRNIIQSLETIQKRSEKLKGINNPNYGKTIPDWHKEINRKSQLGRKQPKEVIELRINKLRGKKRQMHVVEAVRKAHSRVVLDVNSGVFYDSIKEAAASKGYNRRTLNAMLSGQNKNKTTLIYI